MAIQKINRNSPQGSLSSLLQPFAAGIGTGIAEGAEFASDLAKKVQPYSQFIPSSVNPILKLLSMIPEKAPTQALGQAGSVSGLGSDYFKPQGMGAEIIKGITQQAPTAVITGGLSIPSAIVRSALGNFAAQTAKGAGYGALGQSVAQLGTEGLISLKNVGLPKSYFTKEARSAFKKGLNHIDEHVVGQADPLIRSMDSTMNELRSVTNEKISDTVRGKLETIWKLISGNGEVNIKELYKTRFNLLEDMKSMTKKARDLLEPVYNSINTTIDNSLKLDPMAIGSARHSDAIYKNIHKAERVANEALPAFLQTIENTSSKILSPIRGLIKPITGLIRGISKGQVYFENPTLNKYSSDILDAVTTQNIPAFVKSVERFTTESSKNPEQMLPKKGVFKVERPKPGIYKVNR